MWDFLRFLQTLLVITPDDWPRRSYGVPEHDPHHCDFCRDGEYYFNPKTGFHYKV
jgi:hypothetical protein